MNHDAAVAYHEAGHAVIGRVLGMVCGGVSIRPDEDCAGHGWIAVPDVVHWRWYERGRCRAIASVFRGRILTFMAGREAEEELLGRCDGGDDDDQFQIALMMQQLSIPHSDEDCYEARLRRRCRHLVRRHRKAIEAVAKRLLQAGEIAGDDLDAWLSMTPTVRPMPLTGSVWV
jgi:hypothetical protein